MGRHFRVKPLLAVFLSVAAVVISAVHVGIVLTIPVGSFWLSGGAIAASAVCAAVGGCCLYFVLRRAQLLHRMDDIETERRALARMMGYQDARLRSLGAQVELLTAVRELARVTGDQARFEDILRQLVRIVEGVTRARDVAVFVCDGQGPPEPAVHSCAGEVTLDSGEIERAVDGTMVSECWQEKSVRVGGDQDLVTIASVLMVEGERVGVLYLGVPVEGGQADRAGALKQLESDVQDIAKHVALALKHVYLARCAVRDRLTNLYNRAQLREDLAAQLAGSGRARSRCSLLMLDIDHFKLVNDTYGHLTGDRVLKGVADVLAGAVRSGESCYRYGGEEFAILLPRARAADATILAERVRRRLAELDWTADDGSFKVTLSIGIAQDDGAVRRGEDLIALADSALYQAKNAGRDRVVVYGDGGRNA